MDITQDTKNTVCQNIVLVLANIMVALYFLSPLLVLRSYRQKEKMQLKFLPLFQVIFILLNCLFWFTTNLPYNLDFNTPLIKESLPINIFGLVTGIVLLFFCWANSYSENSYLFILILNICNFLFQIAMFIHFYTQNSNKNEENEGDPITKIIAIIFNVLMYLSLLQNPLAIYLEKNYREGSLPLYQIIIGLLSTVVWIIYGILMTRTEVLIPNTLGFIVLIGISLFCLKIIKKFQNNENVNSVTSEGFVSQIETDTQEE
jgi:hypothetical protein